MIVERKDDFFGIGREYDVLRLSLAESNFALGIHEGILNVIFVVRLVLITREISASLYQLSTAWKTPVNCDLVQIVQDPVAGEKASWSVPLRVPLPVKYGQSNHLSLATITHDYLGAWDPR